MDIVTLESIASKYENSLSALGYWLIGATAAIVIGLMVEYWPDINKLRREPSPDLLKQVVGGIIVTAAIALEIFILYRQSRVETKLRTVNHRILSLFDRETEQLRSNNLALEKQIQPRRLDSERMATIKKALSPFADRKIQFESYALDLEAQILGRQIMQALGRICEARRGGLVCFGNENITDQGRGRHPHLDRSHMEYW